MASLFLAKTLTWAKHNTPPCLSQALFLPFLSFHLLLSHAVFTVMLNCFFMRLCSLTVRVVGCGRDYWFSFSIHVINSFTLIKHMLSIIRASKYETVQWFILVKKTCSYIRDTTDPCWLTICCSRYYQNNIKLYTDRFSNFYRMTPNMLQML